MNLAQLEICLAASAEDPVLRHVICTSTTGKKLAESFLDTDGRDSMRALCIGLLLGKMVAIRRGLPGGDFANLVIARYTGGKGTLNWKKTLVNLITQGNTNTWLPLWESLVKQNQRPLQGHPARDGKLGRITMAPLWWRCTVRIYQYGNIRMPRGNELLESADLQRLALALERDYKRWKPELADDINDIECLHDDRAPAPQQESTISNPVIPLPKVSLAYDPSDSSGKGCVFRHDTPPLVREVYLRLRATNESNLFLKQITADLVGLYYRPERKTRNQTTLSMEPHRLNWAFSHGQPRDLDPQGIKFIDLITFRDGLKGFDIMIARAKGGWIYWQDALQNPGYYTFIVRIHPEGCQRVEKTLEFHWKGDIDLFQPSDVREVQSHPLGAASISSKQR